MDAFFPSNLKNRKTYYIQDYDKLQYLIDQNLLLQHPGIQLLSKEGKKKKERKNEYLDLNF